MTRTNAPRSLPVEERLYADEHRPDRVSHLALAAPARCGECVRRECTTVCPAQTYVWDADSGQLAVRFENCLECGACRLVCPHKNIAWRQPMGGMGICYRYG